MTKLLTIVVPVYKVEPYINKCLDSCVLDDENLMSLLEVIIVNDGTPDRSAEMSREYVKRYPNTFRQFDKENGGHGSACNVGLKEATGKYIRFLDSDDWLSNLETLLDVLSKTDVDLVFTHTRNCYVDGNVELKKVEGAIDDERDIENFAFEDNCKYITGISYCTFKTSILKQFYPLFIEGYYYDDTLLFIAPLALAKTYVIKDFALYNYLLGREGQSVSESLVKRQTMALWKTHEYCSMFYDKHKDLYAASAVRAFVNRFLSERAQYIVSLPLIELPFKEAKSAYSMCFGQISNPTGKIYHRFKKYPYFMFWTLERLRNSEFYKKTK